MEKYYFICSERGLFFSCVPSPTSSCGEEVMGRCGWNCVLFGCNFLTFRARCIDSTFFTHLIILAFLFRISVGGVVVFVCIHQNINEHTATQNIITKHPHISKV